MVVLSPDHDHQRIAEHLAGAEAIFEPLRRSPRRAPHRRAMARAAARILRRNALDGRASPLFGLKYEGVRKELREDWPRRVSVPLDLVTRHVLWRSPAARRLALAADLRWSGYREHADLFERYAPELVVAPSPGWYVPDEAVLQEAANRGVHTAAVVHGWDNPTSKGYKAVEPGLVGVWSPRMGDEMIRFHDVDPSRIRVSGVPHWDHYLQDGGVLERGSLLERLGLDPDKPLITFATFVPRTYAFPNAELAEALARIVTGGELGREAQLVIRLHPHFLTPTAEPERRRIEQTAAGFPGVTVQHPEPIAEDLPHPSRGDARMLGALITHSDVLVNAFSTTTLEACLVDTPVVMAGPAAHRTGGADRASAGELAGIEEFEHLRYVVSSGAARVAHSRDELLGHLRKYLEDPALDREQRRALARETCGPTDGSAGRRVGRLLLEQLDQVAGGQ